MALEITDSNYKEILAELLKVPTRTAMQRLSSTYVPTKAYSVAECHNR